MVIRRQEHGIKAVAITVTLPRLQMERLRGEASARGITVSKRVVELIRLAWSVEGALAGVGATAPADEKERAA